MVEGVAAAFGCRLAIASLARYRRAPALGERQCSVCGGDPEYLFQQIPAAVGFPRKFNLEEIIVSGNPTVFSQNGVVRHHVIDREFSYLAMAPSGSRVPTA